MLVIWATASGSRQVYATRVQKTIGRAEAEAEERFDRRTAFPLKIHSVCSSTAASKASVAAVVDGSSYSKLLLPEISGSV